MRGQHRAKQTLRWAGKVAFWPLRRFFDPRFQRLAGMIQADMDATTEATTMLGQSLVELTALAEQIASDTSTLSGTYYEKLLAGTAEDLDERVSRVIDHAASHTGFAAQRGLWFNPPISIAHVPGDVVVTQVNERIAELPYAFRALAELPAGASILDVGGTESTLALSLASLGYRVTEVDPRPYPLSHPNLDVVVSPVEEWEHEGTFAAVVCISTIEHVGIGHYGMAAKEGRADLNAMRRLRELTQPGGLLVLTTRCGKAGVDDVQRTYDREGLDELLEGWSVEDLTIVSRSDTSVWAPGDPADFADAIALVTARRPR